jgi:hypothetical protein
MAHPAVRAELIGGDNQIAEAANERRNVSLDCDAGRLQRRGRVLSEEVLNDGEEPKRVDRKNVNGWSKPGQLLIAVAAIGHALRRDGVTARARALQMTVAVAALTLVGETSEVATQSSDVIHDISPATKQTLLRDR